MKSIDEIYREFPEEEMQALPTPVAFPRMGLPLAILLVMIAVGFWAVLVPFCHGVAGAGTWR